MIHLFLLPIGNCLPYVSFYMEKTKQESHNCPDLREGVFWSGCFQEDQCCHSNTTAAEQKDLSICDSFPTVNAQ